MRESEGLRRGIVLPLVLVFIVILIGLGLVFQSRYKESAHQLRLHQDQIRTIYQKQLETHFL